jgi:alkylation response protein AidB-like acyl-CoA dehydrogenase
MSDLVRFKQHAGDPHDGADWLSRARELSQAFAEGAALVDREAIFPADNFSRLRDNGLLALTAPSAWGGGGAGLSDASRVITEIAKGEPSTALILFMQYVNLALLPRGRAPEPIARQIVGDAVSSGALINSLRVEPDLGSPARGGLPETTARRTENGWRLSGTKIYSTGSTGLTWMLVWARTDEPDIRVGRFLVRANAAGISIMPSWNTLGMRATVSHAVTFRDVELAFDAAVDISPAAEQRGKEPLESAWSACLLGSVYHGIALSARDWLVGFLNSRRPSNLGAPLSSLPRVQEALGRIEEKLFCNEQLLARLGQRVDEGDALPPNHLGFLKSIVTENAIVVVEEALKLTGNHGISLDNPLERHHRNVLCGRIHTPQQDAVWTAAGRALSIKS